MGSADWSNYATDYVYCGNQLPDDYYSFGNTTIIKFQTDDVIEKSGFSISAYAVDGKIFCKYFIPNIIIIILEDNFFILLLRKLNSVLLINRIECNFMCDGKRHCLCEKRKYFCYFRHWFII